MSRAERNGKGLNTSDVYNYDVFFVRLLCFAFERIINNILLARAISTWRQIIEQNTQKETFNPC